MLLKIIFLLTICLNTVLCRNNTVTQGMEENGLIPDILSDGPESTMRIIYQARSIVFRQEISKNRIGNQPITFFPTKRGKEYTILAMDVDYPSRWDRMGQILMLNTNQRRNQFETGDTLLEYIRPTPEEKSGLHRIVFLAFEQTNTMNMTAPEDRDGFVLSDFMDENAGFLKFPAVAGNYFYTRN